MRTFLFLFFIAFCFQSFGQIEFSTTKHNFGELEPFSARYIDISLTNRGSKQGWVLSVKKPDEVSYIQNRAMIGPGETSVLRFNVNPNRKGKFSYTIDVFTSDKNEATQIKLTGSISEIRGNQSGGFTDCPSFGERPAGRNPNAFDLTVVTIDKVTREPLSNSDVTFIQSGRPVWEEKTNRKGMIKKESALGLSYFYASHEGYYPAELGAYVNFKRNYIVLELERDQTPVEEEVVVEVPEEPEVIEEPVEVVEEKPEIVEEEPEAETIVIEIGEDDPVEEPQEEVAETKPEIPGFDELPIDNFDDQYFQPINVVFVLDVSMSMRSADKMELLKYSLNQLTEMIRPQDKIGIVTYASDAQVLMKPTSGSQKESINSKIKELKASGFTAGGKGIKLGYKQAYKSRLEGVNQVVIITDGAFNRDSKDYKKAIKKYKKKGINLSVVGIKNKTPDKIEMEEAAQMGGGKYIPIMGLQDAKENLRQYIRAVTFVK